MKKIVIFFALLAVGIVTQAQSDTLWLGERDTTYYYWDTNWWDHYALNHPTGRYLDWLGGAGGGLLCCKPEVARYCYTAKPLRIIGIAANVNVGFTDNDPNVSHEQLMQEMVDDFFRLYETDSTGNMRLMAQKSWHVLKNSPRHYMEAFIDRTPGPDRPGFVRVRDVIPVYEVFFDSAITVTDSFYVSVTCYNNHYNHANPGHGWASTGVTSIRAHRNPYYPSYDPDECRPNPNHFKIKLSDFSGQNQDYRYGITDTNWYTIVKVYNHPEDTSTPPDCNNFMYIFPIIDTSTMPVIPECVRPEGLTLMYANSGIATLAWSPSGNADHWELSLVKGEGTPDEGSFTEWSNYVATLQGLDTAQWYSAWVRSVCTSGDSTYYSDWSDSIRFYVPKPDDPDDPTGIGSAADLCTHLTPNPATGSVSITSTVRIGEVELYSLDGRRLMQQRIDGSAATLDISQLAAGTYIARIATAAGTTYKKLIVK